MSMIARLALVIAVFAVLLLCGCGGDSSEGESQEFAAEDVSDDITQSRPEAETEPAAVSRKFDSGTPEEELQAVINDVISHLESDDVDGLVSRYIPPNDLEALRQSGRLGKVSMRYRMFKNDMIVTLKEALTLQPNFNDDTTRVVYEVETGPTPLSFVKIGGNWYFPEK